METFVAEALTWVGSFAVVNAQVQEYLRPIMFALVGLAGAVSTFFLVVGGIEYMTSSGKPEKLEHAKTTLRNALIGLVLVIGAASLTAILQGAYSDNSATQTFSDAPVLEPVEVDSGGGGVTEILINSIIGLFKHFIESAASPIINAVDYFTQGTPLMADNEGVFNLWLGTLGIANAIFVLVVALLGFQVMSTSTLGLDEIEFKHLLPRLGITFLLMNMSIFAIDAVVNLTNVMITAITGASGTTSVFTTLSDVMSDAGNQGMVSLLLMIVFIVLSAILLVYYVARIVALYVGAVLSPLVVLLQVVPGFRDFTASAFKMYVATLFNLFVHVIVLAIAATLFVGLTGPDDGGFDPLMSLVGGIAAIFTLLKTQHVMMQISMASTGTKAMRKMSGQFLNGVSYLAKNDVRFNSVKADADGAASGGGKRQTRTNTSKAGYK